MDADGPAPEVRRHPVHGVRIQSNKPTIVFVTACTKSRVPWLARPEIHDALKKVWSAADAWRVGRYIVMPDHVHLFVGLGERELPLDNWMRYWKSQLSRLKLKFVGEWQSDYWDTRLRSMKAYSEKWEYVRHNAVRHGLVSKAEDWPYQGNLNALTWAE